MEEKKLSEEQIKEVNAKVIEIIEVFREGLCNSAAFDYGNYWRFGMDGKGVLSEACKHVYNTKALVVDMIDKEMNMVLNNNEEQRYHKKRRVYKEKVIESLRNLLEPALQGRREMKHHVYMERVVNLADFVLEKGEELSQFATKGKFLKKID